MTGESDLSKYLIEKKDAKVSEIEQLNEIKINSIFTKVNSFVSRWKLQEKRDRELVRKVTMENIRILNRNETFPGFTVQFNHRLLTPQNWELWRQSPTFLFNRTNAECDKCEYRGETRDKKGNVYLGQWNANNKYEGRGAMIYQHGDIYQGYWKNGSYEGMGRLIGPNQQMYYGHWKGGTKQGKGKLLYSNGDRYEGNLISNKKNGYGVMYYASGDKFVG